MAYKHNYNNLATEWNTSSATTTLRHSLISSLHFSLVFDIGPRLFLSPRPATTERKSLADLLLGPLKEDEQPV